MTEPDARSSVLAFKLLAMVLATGGILSGLLALAVTRLPTSERAGALVYVIPGSGGNTVLDTRIVTVLGGGAALFCGLATVAAFAVLMPFRNVRRIPASRFLVRPRRRMPKRVLAGGLLLLALVVPIRWYGYVTSSATTTNVVGGWLNAHAPAPLRDWGCARLRERISNQAPPVECRNPNEPPLSQ